tara:strand:+ start:429 stop:1040 length:612 start_codon:yes stop_codon:yes gene_type:complete
MSQIKLKHSGGNSVIIAAPDSNPASDRTLKLPSDADGTILTTNSATGKILQVVSTTKTDQFSVTPSAAETAITGLTASITPNSTSNKVLITCHLSAIASNNVYTYFAFTRGGSKITAACGDAQGSRSQAMVGTFPYNDTDTMNNFYFHYLDSPSSTSALTYGVNYIRGSTSSHTFYVNYGTVSSDVATRATFSSTITAMEVAA